MMFGRGAGPFGETAPADTIRGTVPYTPMAAEPQSLSFPTAAIHERLGRATPWALKLRDSTTQICVGCALRQRPRPRTRRRRHTARASTHRAESGTSECDPARDLEHSILAAYEAVRARIAAGGPGWTPRPCRCRCCGGAS